MKSKIFVGIGSGAVQLGLWAYYANRFGARIVLTEVDEEKIKSIKRNKNFYYINIAHFDRIENVRVGPIKIYNPSIKEERDKIISSIRNANDIVTAVPSTSIYEKGGIVELLRVGLREKKNPVIIYASENQIKAAKMLEKLVFPEDKPAYIQFSETVIERMGGPQYDELLIDKLNLKKITPKSKDALLVEDFDKIVIEKPTIPSKYRYKSCFEGFFSTKNTILYEELKLYGHNAVHLLLGFIGKLKGYKFMSQYNGDSDYGYIGVDALMYETGYWFKKKYKNSNEDVTRETGYKKWVEQLCRRITNPFLYDLVERIIRDIDRKLGWNDRIIGTMRNALSYGITPKRYALGVAAALYEKNLTREKALLTLKSIWGKDSKGELETKILSIVGIAFNLIKQWKSSKERSLYKFMIRKKYLN